MTNTQRNFSSRNVALAWIAGGAVWSLNGLIGLRAHVGTGGLYAAEVVWLAVHGLVLIGIVGLLRSGATGDLRWGQAGLGLAAIARILFICLEVASIILGTDNLPVFPVAVISTGVGMLIGGMAVARAGHWSGWARIAPLAMGAYPFLFIVPIFAATGARPPDVIIAGWGVAIAAVGFAMASHRANAEFSPV